MRGLRERGEDDDGVVAAQPLDQGQVLVENGTLFGVIEAGGYDRITDNPSAESEDDSALDAAAMEFGTD